MNVIVDAHSETLNRQRVDSGRYPDASAVVSAALRMLDEHDRVQELRANLQIGLDQIERGEVVEFTPELLDDLAR